MNHNRSTHFSTFLAPAARRRSHSCDLLVSVRSLAEAEIAIAGGADIIDFKEPLEGALAPVEPEIWRQAAAAFPGRTLSAALGESPSATRLAAFVPKTFRYAKAGPSQIQTTSRLGQFWNDLDLPSGVELVAVAYADYEAAGCPRVDEILELAISQGRRRILIDTFVKDGSCLTDHLALDELATLIDHARNANGWIALAGSLRLDDVSELLAHDITPDCWGVRGDVCMETSSVTALDRRTGSLDPRRIERWTRLCDQASSSGSAD
ncbi:(5-formylfuran-3-yl)methyl phosphate synthase [Neorhodopirellula pilleata]|uniref:(5-formylfuran-3-yl)methyl phosphate synthase n=1 Tax=Neorhodopirellula pilleata TaxID=2714738 RepID=A0A5C6AGS0_9BACT|nr:(5-formylfuran-3-yl)methyl phosphate synthase [Neorhodopirellula pilleata]TWT98809.1 hypothetical protein Pla100_19750 [Neorhodopirellula pilleata]